jgi:hypothetical protein
MKLSQFSRLVEPFYTDKLSIKRHTGSEDPVDHTTKAVLSKEPIYSGIPCKISFSHADSPNADTDSLNPISLEIKIICSVSVDIKKGDSLTAYKMAEDGTTVLGTYTGIANLPLIYATHKEILFIKAGVA